jgi:hypothetical protein
MISRTWNDAVICAIIVIASVTFRERLCNIVLPSVMRFFGFEFGIHFRLHTRWEQGRGGRESLSSYGGSSLHRR